MIKPCGRWAYALLFASLHLASSSRPLFSGFSKSHTTQCFSWKLSIILVPRCHPSADSVPTSALIVPCGVRALQDGVSVPQVHKRFFMLHWVLAESFSACCIGAPLHKRAPTFRTPNAPSNPYPAIIPREIGEVRSEE